MKKGNLAEALQLIDKSLRSGPRSPRLLSAAAHVHIVQKDYAARDRAARGGAPRHPGRPRDLAAPGRGLPRLRAPARRAPRARGAAAARPERPGRAPAARRRCTSPRAATTRRSTTCCRWSTSWWSAARSTAPRGLLQQIVQRHAQHFKSLAKLVELYRLSKNDMLVAQTYGQMVEAYMATGGLEQAASILDMLVQLEPHNEQHRTKLRWLREQKGVARRGQLRGRPRPAGAAGGRAPARRRAAREARDGPPASSCRGRSRPTTRSSSRSTSPRAASSASTASATRRRTSSRRCSGASRTTSRRSRSSPRSSRRRATTRPGPRSCA